MLRLAGSLQLGRVPATGIMRTLQVGDRPTRLAQAIAEFGRIEKTLHSLNMLDDDAKRRGTLSPFNRGEWRHSLGRAVFHGKRGELRQRYREGQGGSAWRAGTRGQHDRPLEHDLHRSRA
jgi:TnpA family transposase